MPKGLLEYDRSREKDFLLAEDEAVAHAAVVLSKLLADRDLRNLADEIGTSKLYLQLLLVAGSRQVGVQMLGRIGRACGRRLRLEFVSDQEGPL